MIDLSPGIARMIAITITILLTLWAGAMFWWAPIEIANNPDEWLGPASWAMSSFVCWVYWYRKVMR